MNGNGIDRPTTAIIRDAVAEADEHEGLLQALTEEGAVLSQAALTTAAEAIRRALVVSFPNCNTAKEIALVATVAAHMCAVDLIHIEAASPISNAARDGRVKAVETFFARLLQRAVEYRAIAAIKIPGQLN